MSDTCKHGERPSECAQCLTLLGTERLRKSERPRARVVAAIRAFTVEIPPSPAHPCGAPNGPTEAALDRLWRMIEAGGRGDLRDACAAYLSAAADQTQELREAAEAFFGGDFRAPQEGERPR